MSYRVFFQIVSPDTGYIQFEVSIETTEYQQQKELFITIYAGENPSNCLIIAN